MEPSISAEIKIFYMVTLEGVKVIVELEQIKDCEVSYVGR
jgi:hypothetical protein